MGIFNRKRKREQAARQVRLTGTVRTDDIVAHALVLANQPVYDSTPLPAHEPACDPAPSHESYTSNDSASGYSGYDSGSSSSYDSGGGSSDSGGGGGGSCD